MSSGVANEMTRKLAEVQARRNARSAAARAPAPAPAARHPYIASSISRGPLFARPAAAIMAARYISPAARTLAPPPVIPSTKKPRTRRARNNRQRRTLRR